MLFALSFLACGGGADPWAPTENPFDPECARCVLVTTGGSGHIGEAEYYEDAALDDPAAQWATCVESIVDCAGMDAGRLEACVDEAPCPKTCQKAFQREGADVDAFEAVFLLEDGACTGEGL